MLAISLPFLLFRSNSNFLLRRPRLLCDRFHSLAGAVTDTQRGGYLAKVLTFLKASTGKSQDRISLKH